MKFTLAEIAAFCGGKLCGDGNTEVTAFYTDSRKTEPGAMFVPIRGENTDAHRFIPQVFAAGAAAVFSEETLESSAGNVVYVENTIAALQAVAAAHRARFAIPVIGITGSVGKTTTKEMVALAVSAGRRVMKTAGNANSQIGLPLTVLRLAPEDEAAIVEMGVSMPGEMARIARVAKPNLALVTNIGVSHIEYMKTRENILAEKMHIADYIPQGGTVLVNGDDDLLSTLQSDENRRILRFGMQEGCDYRAVDLKTDAKGTHFVCVHGAQAFPMYVPAAGEHNVRNALAALAVAEMLGVPAAAAIQAIQGYTPPAMRQQIFEANGITLIDDTYNASPDSTKAALKLLTQLETRGKRYAVLADMLELGDYAAQSHFEVGAAARALSVDFLVCIGSLAKNMIDGFDNASQSKWFETNEAAIQFLKAELKAGDCVLCKGSRGMAVDEIIRALS